MSNKGRTHRLLICILVIAGGVLTDVASASILTITQTGTGAGTLAGVAFPASNFTITSIMNTANRQSYPGGWFINNTSASIQINGLGNFNFLTGTRVYVNNSFREAGFSRPGIGGSDLFTGPNNFAFQTWNMLTPIGPINGQGNLLQWASPPEAAVNTTGGILVFNNGSSATTFTAVPEPATLFLLAIGAIAAMRRRIKP